MSNNMACIRDDDIARSKSDGLSSCGQLGEFMGADTVSESKQGSIKSRVLSGNIHLVLRSSLFRNSPHAQDMDGRSLIDNTDILQSLLSDSQLTAVTDENALYCFLLAREISQMNGLVTEAEKWALSAILDYVADKARDAYDNCKLQASAADYITHHERDIFPVPEPDAGVKSQPDAELEYASLDFIIERKAGIKGDDFFKYLCQNYPDLIVYRFDELGYVFIKYPDLLHILFSSCHIDLEKSSCVVALDILKNKYKNENTRYKALIDGYAAALYQKAVPFGKTLSEDNVVKREPVIKSVASFLHAVKSPDANGFSEYVNTAEELLRKVSIERMKSFKKLFSCPVEIWKNSDKTLLDLSHNSGTSHISINPVFYQYLLRQCVTYILKGNFLGQGNFQDEKYRWDLQLTEDCHSATFQDILSDRTALDKFSDLLRRAVQYVSVNMSQYKCSVQRVPQKIPLPDDGLSEDTELLLGMLDAVAENMNERCRKQEISCYSTSMFLCSLTEKLLRLLDLFLAKDKSVMSYKTLGRLLSTGNKELTKVFGSGHILNLACFLIGMPGIKSGPSYRNSLAHWSSGMSPDKMTPKLVSSLLWLFTDILNSIVLYFKNRTFCGVYGDADDKK